MGQSPDKLPVLIIEAYKDYRPPKYVKRAVENLLRTAPKKYLVGLGSIILTNFSGKPSKRRSGKISRGNRKIARSNIYGLYTHASRRNRPYIGIYIDKILAKAKWYNSLPLAREMVLGQCLFHELGHHAHSTIRPEHRDRELVANEWCDKFLGNFLRKKYWYLLPILVPAAWVASVIKYGPRAGKASRQSGHHRSHH